MTSPRDPRSGVPRAALWALAGLSVLVVVVLMALIDARRTRNHVQRNVVVAGENIGRMSADSLDSFLDQLEGRYRTMSVAIVPPQGAFNVTGSELGVSVQRDRLRRELLRIGRSDSAGDRVRSYFGAFFGTDTIEVPVSVDATVVAQTISDNDTESAEQPVDPTLAVQGDKFVIKPGKPGMGISPGVIVSTLEQLLPGGPNPLEIPVERVVLPSRYTDAELSALLDRAVQLASKPLAVRIDGKEITVQPKQLRRLVTPTLENEQVSLKLDGDKALALVLNGIGSVGRPAIDARLQVNDDGTVTHVASETGLRCCTDDAADQLNAAVAGGSGEIVELRLEEVQPKVTTEQIQSLGVSQLVSTFTTKHAPGEVRVKNIHHIADLIRGIVIKPGDTFSVNETIGPRTAANGFFKAHVIEDGVYAENFGGGISQFATTMFNAAFFAGLDLVEYQSHSLYISRYPFGREATLSFPDPDLKIRNNTPYGILIWPTYSARSITVNLYSTPFVKGEVVDQVVEPKDQCKIVYTYRLRTYVDGTTKKDRTRAFYRPAEGKDCQGNPTAGATTTTLKPKVTKPESDTTRPSGSDGLPDSQPVQAGADSDSTKAGTSKPESTKVEGTTAKPKVTKPPETKAEPKPTSPPGDGNVGVGGPPVTGLG